MINKINWQVLQNTTADGKDHQLGETLYRHTAAACKTPERITARFHGSVYQQQKDFQGDKLMHWRLPIRLYWAQNLRQYVSIPGG